MHTRTSEAVTYHMTELEVCNKMVNVEIPTEYLILVFWTRIYLAFANSVDPDQLVSKEAN